MDIFNRAKKHQLEFMWHAHNTELLTHIRFRRHGPFKYHGRSFGQFSGGGDDFCVHLFSSLRDFEKLILHEASGSLRGDLLFHYGGDDF